VGGLAKRGVRCWLVAWRPERAWLGGAHDTDVVKSRGRGLDWYASVAGSTGGACLVSMARAKGRF
jgi:hypothetical protein